MIPFGKFAFLTLVVYIYGAIDLAAVRVAAEDVTDWEEQFERDATPFELDATPIDRDATHIDRDATPIERDTMITEGYYYTTPRTTPIGRGPVRKITLYQHSNYRGAYRIYYYSASSFPGFDDKVSSIKVEGGGWVLYKDGHFRGSQYFVDVGNYPNPDSWGGKHDDLSSVKLVCG